LDVEETVASPPRKAKRVTREWEDREKSLVNNIMRGLMQEDGEEKKTEKKWSIVSGRLEILHDIQRSWTAVKNYWNREGRAATGLDERQVKRHGGALVTGVQSSVSRKKQRQAKRKEA